MSHTAFSLLAVPIQKVLWQMGWTELRPIQVDAIPLVLQGDADLIISAQTASGKTEAAFLPVLSRILEGPQDSVKALYVGPLKALINDQFRRLEDLCQHAHIPVHRWHGDVSAARKRKLVERPSGVLLITPESLESLFINRSAALPKIFRHLRFVVIDELHAFVGRERGTHLRSLLFRLERHVEGGFRLIALSATFGQDVRPFALWLRPDNAEAIRVVRDDGGQKGIQYRIYGYSVADDARDEIVQESTSHLSQQQSDAPTGLAPLVSDIFKAFAGDTNLVFANRKNDVELFADLLNDRCRRDGRPEEFLVHHGSLSKEVREQTEAQMQGQRPYTALCSSTLELGIDIGEVHAVGQLGAPWSVGSLVQRLGRSGRREDKAATMRVYLELPKLTARSSLVDRLFPELLQAVALTELMLAGWIEPPNINELDLSTCVQQILSVLGETGGVLAEALYDCLASHGAFRRLDARLFADVLRSLASHDLIEQIPQGELILGLAGQEIVRHYYFYSAFMTPVEYRVTYTGRPIGTLPAMYVPPIRSHFLLAARRWEVVSVDHRRQEILVRPARGRKPPLFPPRGGEIHAEVRRKMRAVLLGTDTVPYLNEHAAQLLEDARAAARDALLDRTVLVELSDDECLWFTWTGTRGQRTLALLAAGQGLKPEDEGLALAFSASAQKIREAFASLHALPSPLALAARIEAKQTRKYDSFLSDEILTHGLADYALDLPEAKAVVEQVTGCQ